MPFVHHLLIGNQGVSSSITETLATRPKTWHDFPGGYLVNRRLSFAFAALMAVPGALFAQEKSPAQSTPPANPITASEKGLYSFVSSAVVGAAQKMPEENYSFRPTPEVRSFGQLVGHLADANYMFC